MKLFEMWSSKPTNVWLHRLNKDGSESGMRDARRYFASKKDAVDHHNHMVDANPNRVIAHNLHMRSDLGNFVLKLVGKQTARAEKKHRNLTLDQLIRMMDEKGSAASVWLPDFKWEELLKLYNSGADVKVVGHILPNGADADEFFKKKAAMMKNKGYDVFAQEKNFDSLDMIFVRT